MEEQARTELLSADAGQSRKETIQSSIAAVLFFYLCQFFAYRLYHPFVSPVAMTVWLTTQIGLGVYWAIAIVRLILSRDERVIESAGWSRNSKIVVVGVNLSVLADFWLLAPGAELPLQFVALLVAALYAALVLVNTPEWTDQNGPSFLYYVNRYASIIILVSGIVFLVVERLPHWPYVSVFLFAYLLTLLVMGRAHTGAVRAVHSARKRAEEDRDARTRFMASASHDLGQPLQSARLLFDQAVRHPEREERERAAREAKDALGAIDRQLRSMLDHLRLDAGVLTPSLQIVAVGPLIALVSSMFEPVAALAGVEIKALPSRLTVRADPDMLERVLSNLVDNALRHADAKRLLIGTLGQRILVIDDGRGVAIADLPHLFEDFAQGSDKGGKERGGFGLGLSSVRRLMALMEGTAAHDPRWTKGSAFSLTFAAPPATGSAAP